ncbi:MAG TPA: MFS transporter [Streptosporangiaceae bacterium]|jgi:MFS family permease
MTVAEAPVQVPVRPKTGAVLAVTGVAPLLVLMNYSTPLIMVPQTAAHLGAGASGQVWIMSSISLGLAALLLVAGGLADDYGRRRVFVIGAALLAASSLVGAAAPDTLVFVLARIVQGMASAALLVTSLGIMGHTFPTGHGRLRATGLYGAMMGAGVAVGPLLGGALERPAGWNAAYWIYALAAALLALSAMAFLPESRAERPRRLDLGGVITLGLGLAALLAAITEGRAGWFRGPVVTLFGIAAMLIGAFVAIENRRRQPLLEPDLFRRPLFLLATVGAVIQGLAVIGLMSDLSTVLERRQAFTPLTAAAAIAYWSSVAFLVSLQVKKVRLRPGRLLAAGFLSTAVGDLLLLGVTARWSWPQAAAGLLIAGAGYGIANAALARLALDSVPADRGSVGSGANNTARYIGSAVGVPIVVAVVTAAGFDTALWICAGLLALAAGLPFLLQKSRLQEPGNPA